MRKLLLPVALATGVFLLAPPAAQASTERSSAAETATQLRSRVTVTYPKEIRRGWPARYTFKVANPNEIDDETLVLATDLPRGIVSKVRFVTKPRGASCGTHSRNAAGNYEIYCVVRSLNHTKLTMSFNVWIKTSYYGKFRAGHYWAPVSLGGGSVRDYVDELTKDDLIGHTWTKVR
ncbi:hypothetical protein [Sphaerisporangium perillae]|uniref:hypothetical protein n=1 Tax=Sphaerisporangium perillae TaxID=2935860 RepID=UPI00200C57E6|nr:hypothetical protein [Sphaerisporangium perillae]